MLVVCGVREAGGLHADFMRAEVPLVFKCDNTAAEPTLTGPGVGIATFETREACLVWCQREQEKRVLGGSKPEGELLFFLYRM